MPRTSAMFGLAALGIALASSSTAWAGPPEEPKPAVVILKFTGDEWLREDQRARLGAALEARGYEPRLVRVSLADAAARMRCDPSEAQCRVDIGRYLVRNLGASFDYYVWADLPLAGTGEVGVFELGSGQVVVSLDLAMSPNDLILPEMLSVSVARRIHELRVPPAPPSEAELEQLAALDHDVGPPIPLRPPPPSCGDPGVCCYPEPPFEWRVDLRDDFDDWCRVEPRDDARFGRPDLRPVCKLGPTFGYFRPRTWTMLSLTAASAVSTGVLYGLAFGAPSSWPEPTTDRLEIGAHAMLAGTAVLGTILTLVILRDRRQARRFLEGEARRLELLP